MTPPRYNHDRRRRQCWQLTLLCIGASGAALLPAPQMAFVRHAHRAFGRRQGVFATLVDRGGGNGPRGVLQPSMKHHKRVLATWVEGGVSIQEREWFDEHMCLWACASARSPSFGWLCRNTKLSIRSARSPGI